MRDTPAANACVIGAGIGGLALAIRLQSAGIATTLLEAREKPGGRAYFWEDKGFTFDAGPTIITDPQALQELWSLSGHNMSQDVELMKVSPSCRYNWPDGSTFNCSDDRNVLNREIGKFNPADLRGYEDFLQYASVLHEKGYKELGQAPFSSLASMLKAAPHLLRFQPWRSLYSILSKYIQHEKLRQAFSFQSLLTGANPMSVSALNAINHTIEMESGIWWARGGTNRLIAGMVRHFERLGGKSG